MSFKFLSALKKKKIEPNNENIVCANCETKFSGNFCPNCGQSIKEYDKALSFVFYNFLGDFFAFDMRFFRSLVTLLFKPGFLSKEYIEGRRVKFAPPFRIFVFVSFVLFLMLQTYTNRGLTTVLDADLGDRGNSADSIITASADSLADVITQELSDEELEIADSVLQEYGVSLDSLSTEKPLNFNLDFASFKDTKDIRHGLEKLAVALDEKLEKEEDLEAKIKLREHIRLCRSPEQAMVKILEYISWAFFLLLPLFAALLKLVYARRKQNYMRHLIFSIHIHAFIYIIMIFIIAMHMSIPGNLGTATSLLIFTVPIYLIIAMKRFYRQGIRKTILKFMVLSFLYNIVFLVLVVGAVLNALNLV